MTTIPTSTNYPSMDTSYDSKPLQVSYKERDSRIQQLIDESFRVQVLPLHEGMFDGKFMNYIYVGSEDYTFIDSKGSMASIKASKIAQEFANKERFDVLDLGTGNGMFLKGMKDRFSNVNVMGVSAADFRPTHYGNKEVTIPDEEYVVGDIENLSKLPALQGRKFDLIVSAVTFRHLSDPLRVICQAYEMLKPNGVLIVDDFKLNGISMLAYTTLFKDSGCDDVEIIPKPYQFPGLENYFPSEHPDQTMIRKKTEHLDLPLSYDLEKSTRATDMDQAHIFYKVEQ